MNNHKLQRSQNVRVHIFGASGSGTTTLGAALAETRSCAFFDADDYFWKVKYTEIHDRAFRLESLARDLGKHESWVLAGSVCGWGDLLIPMFDIAVFLYLPRDIRMERLREREAGRYGEAILPGGKSHETYSKFIDWASRYDEGDEHMRSLKLHEAWLAGLPCPVLRIEGDYTVMEKMEMVYACIDERFTG